ncbi:hypothetical protein DL89DRAFT_290670 [Linderina pennispora]|uniref:DM14 domain-containing protein n=1 Tax=Linderina pennispora TaxID=61395 RepID=A0A1Y1WHZ3_9FUNG|nr:uncharacterized protein DL89DRAFT_290670 [Linderina pennispora]ORX72846.1 hypothetical protein DL89DRAFT_290670 [Linderina pennispora]
MYLISGRARGSARNSRSPRTATPSLDWISTTTNGDDVDATDLNDPELLGELAALRSEMGLSSPPARKTPARQPSQNAAASMAFDEDDKILDSVEVTEEDMNDPGLLAELSQYGGAAMPEETAKPAKAPDNSALLEALNERTAELKSAALTAKRQGDMDIARGMLMQMKAVQEADKGFAMPPKPTAPESPTPKAPESPVLPAPGPRKPKTPDLATQPAPEPPVTSAPRVAASASQTPAKGVTSPAPKRTAAVSTPAQSSSTPGPTARVFLDDPQLQNLARVAVDFGAMTEQLELQISHATHKPRALEFHRYKKRAQADLATVASYQANQRLAPPARRDISVNELQIAIKRVVSDGDLEATLNGSADSFVQWEISWPRDKPSKAYARTIKFSEFDSGDVGLDYSQNIAIIDRQHPRPLMRWIERGRLVVEFYKYNGLLWGSQLIGRGSVPLADLRTRSEVTALVEMKAGADTSGTRGGKTLAGGPVFVDVAVRLRLPLSNQQEISEHEMDDIALHLDSMDDILSNAVLELELAQIPTRIQSADHDAASQLQELASAIKLRMSVVAAQVGAGTISIQDYMDGVTKELATAKDWALKAKRAMQNELSEMQSAMEAGEE